MKFFGLFYLKMYLEHVKSEKFYVASFPSCTKIVLKWFFCSSHLKPKKKRHSQQVGKN